MYNYMITIQATAKKWGNSVGIIFPKMTKIREGQKVCVHVELEKKRTTVRDIFGSLPSKISTQKLLKEVDRELDSEY